MDDYFSDEEFEPKYPEENFMRMYRMSYTLFNKIVNKILSYDVEPIPEYFTYFTQRCDATGRLSIDPIMKCTSAIRQLAYGTAPNAFDEYLQIAERANNDLNVLYGSSLFDDDFADTALECPFVALIHQIDTDSLKVKLSHMVIQSKRIMSIVLFICGGIIVLFVCGGIVCLWRSGGGVAVERWWCSSKAVVEQSSVSSGAVERWWCSIRAVMIKNNILNVNFKDITASFTDASLCKFSASSHSIEIKARGVKGDHLHLLKDVSGAYTPGILTSLAGEMKARGVKGDHLHLLKDVSGAYTPGILNSLAGVSRAGKITLMDILAR
ncbi:hypothetical protein Tco_1144640 [Tanacetum coccineum]